MDTDAFQTIDGVLLSADGRTLVAYPPQRAGEAYEVPDGVREIGERAFMDCKALSKVVLQSEKTKIGVESFLRCGKLTTAGLIGTLKGKGYSFEFPWTKEIPENAFSGMNKLKKVVLPETVKSIGKNALYVYNSSTLSGDIISNTVDNAAIGVNVNALSNVGGLIKDNTITNSASRDIRVSSDSKAEIFIPQESVDEAEQEEQTAQQESAE